MEGKVLGEEKRHTILGGEEEALLNLCLRAINGGGGGIRKLGKRGG